MNPTGNAPIRVCYVQPSLAKYRAPVYRELARRPGIDLLVAYSKQPTLPNVEPDGFRGVATKVYRYYPGGSTRGLYWNPACMHYARPSVSDVVVLPWDLHGVAMIPALLRARAGGVGTVIWGHGYSKREGRVRKFCRDLIPHLSDSVMFYTPQVAERFVADGFPAGRVFSANNALDQAPIAAAREAWLADPSRLEAWQRQRDLHARPVLLFVSRLERDNRVDLLLDAAAQLAGELPALRTVIVGKGEALEELQDQARRLNITDRVVFAGAIYEEEQIAPYFLSARAFCYPQNIGLSCLHAMGYGLPVVTSDNTASQNPEIAALRHEQNGLLYAHGRTDALVATLRRVLTDDDLRARLSADALRTVREEFSLGRMVDGMVAAIQNAYRRRRGG